MLLHVNISYATLDIISVQLKFRAVAYAKSLKETQSQDRHRIYPGKPWENPSKLPMYKMYKI